MTAADRSAALLREFDAIWKLTKVTEASDKCECGKPISELRQWNGKTVCVDCEATS